MSDPIDLKALAGVKYRVTLDPSAAGEPLADRPWFYRIPCKFGFIGVHGPETLMAHCRSRRLFARLLAIPDVTARQRGDREINVTFPPGRLDDVAQLLAARRCRPRLSAERRAELIARGETFRFRRGPGEVPGPEDASGHEI
jgi:hypothetical protein